MMISISRADEYVEIDRVISIKENSLGDVIVRWAYTKDNGKVGYSTMPIMKDDRIKILSV